MKKLQFKVMYAAIVLFTISAVNITAQKAEKEISKDYTISKGFELGIENKYGSIEVVNWDKNELSVVVLISTEAPTQDKAEEMLGKIE